MKLRGHSLRSRRRLLAGVATVLCLCVLPAVADGPSEYQVKAAFIQKFTSFIEWPHYVFHYDESPFVIGILGKNPFGDALETVIADKDFAGRPFEIRHFASAQEVRQCQILYISEELSAELDTILASLDRDGLLTVSDHEDFTLRGGILRFFVEDHRVRFEINIAAAREYHLKISSKLLSLARIVGADAKGESS